MLKTIINDFFDTYNRKHYYNYNWSQNGLNIYINNKFYDDSINNREECYKLLAEQIKDHISDISITETFLIGTCSQTKEALKILKEEQKQEISKAKNHCNDFNNSSKYWEVSFDVDNIDNNEGWQYLISFHYGLNNIETKQGDKMKIEQNNIDFDKKTNGWAMINGVIVEGFNNIYVGLGEVYLNDDNSNISVSIPIDNVKIDDFWIADRDSDGYHENEQDISQWIKKENNKILQALAKSLEESHKKNESKRKTEKVIKQISNQYECYVYTAFDDDNDNISSMDNITGYNDEYACCIEIFSDLADPNDYEESNFGITDEYIDDIAKIKEQTIKESVNIEIEYHKYAVKTTVSKWNEGCQHGMAIYVWIPYQ